MPFSQLKSQTLCYGRQAFTLRSPQAKRGERKKGKKSNLPTKIRKFVFLNLIEAVKHVELDLWFFFRSDFRGTKAKERGEKGNVNKTNLGVTWWCQISLTSKPSVNVENVNFDYEKLFFLRFDGWGGIDRKHDHMLTEIVAIYSDFRILFPPTFKEWRIENIFVEMQKRANVGSVFSSAWQWRYSNNENALSA